MKNSYDSKELIQDVLEDIDTFGKSFKIFALYTEGFITEYIDCDMPTRGEMDEGTEEEYQQAVKEYKEDLARLEGRDYEALTLQELFFKLQEQDEIL